MDIQIDGPLFKQAEACTPILRALPDWFGIESSLLQYAGEIDALPTFLARSLSQALGFLSLKQHFPESAEVYVMGVRPELHGQGIGRALLLHAEAYLLAKGVEYLQVKTLGPSNPDPGYALTRSFYQAMGFQPLEELRQIWDTANPCLVMVKRL